MEHWEQFIKTLIEGLGFTNYKVDIDAEHRHGAVFIYEDQELVKGNLPALVEAINHLVQLIAQKQNSQPIFFDINNYRRERETLIGELARAAARKVVATKEPISLPAMNSYERRIVHTELAANPEVRTESQGAGKERYVIIKPVA